MRVELVATGTVWACFSAFLILPHLGAPALLHRTAMTLLCAELLALMVWSYGSDDCLRRPCGALPETARTAAALDIPVLTVALLAICAAYGLRRTRAR